MRSVPHLPITISRLKEWGYVPTSSGAYVNWNGVWLRDVGEKWEYGNPNWHTIDDLHPFIKAGNVEYLDDLSKIQTRGLEYKTYNSSWK